MAESKAQAVLDAAAAGITGARAAEIGVEPEFEPRDLQMGGRDSPTDGPGGAGGAPGASAPPGILLVESGRNQGFPRHPSACCMDVTIVTSCTPENRWRTSRQTSMIALWNGIQYCAELPRRP